MVLALAIVLGSVGGMVLFVALALLVAEEEEGDE